MKTETQSKTTYQKGLTDQFSLFTLIKQLFENYIDKDMM